MRKGQWMAQLYFILTCGIDSVVTELIKEVVDDFPFMVLKIDMSIQGDAGMDTRIGRLCDMLERRGVL